MSSMVQLPDLTQNGPLLCSQTDGSASGLLIPFDLLRQHMSIECLRSAFAAQIIIWRSSGLHPPSQTLHALWHVLKTSTTTAKLCPHNRDTDVRNKPFLMARQHWPVADHCPLV